MIACENSGHDVFSDFAEVSKIVEAGTTNKPIKDYELSRYYGFSTCAFHFNMIKYLRNYQQDTEEK